MNSSLKASTRNIVVIGMPQSAIEHVDTDFIGTLDRLAARIAWQVSQALPLPPEKPPRHGQQVETLVALGENGMQAGVMELGQPSKYSCPECNGVLIQVDEERILILQQLAELADKDGDPDKAARLRAKAAMAQQKCKPLRDLVLDTDFFASD